MDPVAVILIIVFGIVALFVVASVVNAAQRRKEIYRMYGRTPLAEKIIARNIWQGQTQRQLRDSLGNPADTDEKVLKTKTKTIWKYHHRGGNRYGLRITVENGVVVGWDEKM